MPLLGLVVVAQFFSGCADECALYDPPPSSITLAFVDTNDAALDVSDISSYFLDDTEDSSDPCSENECQITLGSYNGDNVGHTLDVDYEVTIDGNTYSGMETVEISGEEFCGNVLYEETREVTIDTDA